MKLGQNDISIFDRIHIGLYKNTPGPKGKFIDANAALLKMFGYRDKKDFFKIKVSDLYDDPSQRRIFNAMLLKKGFVKRKDLVLKKKDGRRFHVQVTATAVRDKNGKVRWFEGLIEDISEIKRDQERFKLLFEHSPVAIWEEDCSSFSRLLTKLKRMKVKNVKKYLEEHPKLLVEAFRNIRVLDVNRAALALYGAKSKNELMANFGRTFPKSALKVLIDEFDTLSKGQRLFETELKSRTLSGKLYDVLLRVSIPDGYEKSLSRVIVTLENITERKRLEKRLKVMAQMDSLTKLYNYRTITRRLKEELIRARRYHLNLSCLMIDLDYFKVVNDKFGHQRGDLVLKRVAGLMKRGLRTTDIIGRYGGDEFFVILTETKLENARIAAKRIQEYVSSKLQTSTRKLPVKISLSVGISGYPSDDVKDSKDLINKADKGLYVAKASGRDCVMEG